MKKTSSWILIQCATALNIAAGIAIAHRLPPTEFGRFATMSAALMMMTSVLNPLSNELAHLVSAHHGIPAKALRSRSLLAAAICIGISIATCASITQSLQEGLLLFVILPVSMIAFTWICGALTGLHRMRTLGCAQTLGAALKLAIILVGFSLFPSFSLISWAYQAGFVVATAVGLSTLLPLTPAGAVAWRTHWGILGGFFCLALPFSLDQPIIQARFPNSSGEYAAVMTYAKSLMLLLAPGLTIAYSSALQARHSAGLHLLSLRALILFALATTLAVVGLWAALPILFPLLLGQQYLHLIPSAPAALIAIGFHVVGYAVIQLAVLVSRWWISLILIVPALLQATWLSVLQTPSIDDLVRVNLWTFGAQLVVALGMCCGLFVEHRK
jgi:O-antigen/teichoic acid export membrane protein